MPKNPDLYPLPQFLGSKRCLACENIVPVDSYDEIGFYFSGEYKGRMYIRYDCPECGTKGSFTFGDEVYNLEKLCTLIISQSKFLSEADKVLWYEKFGFNEEQS